MVNDLLGEMAWRSEVPGLQDWIRDHVRGRYGSRPAAADQAWQLLLETAYRSDSYTGACFCDRPALESNPNAILAAPPPYDNARLAQAWHKLLVCADELGGADTYRFDLVHVNRQVLGNLAFQFRRDMVAAYRQKDRRALAAAGARFLQLVRDIDELLATREELLLGRWLADARHWATNDEERRLYEWNARGIITLWGPRNSLLHEYAAKQWSGMLVGFYLPRWEMFLRRLDASLAEGKALDAAASENALRDWEVQWTHRTDAYPTVPRGDAVVVSRRLWEKYGRYFDQKAAGHGTPE